MGDAERRRGARVGVVLAGIGGALALLGVGAVSVLERWANHRKEEAIAELSERLGRSVTAGHVDLRLWRGARVELRDLVVGGDRAVPGEPDPALRVGRIRLRVALLRTLLSGGRRAVVKDSAIEGLTANVVRFPDGRLNWQEIAARLAEDRPSAPPDPATVARLRGLRVERAHLAPAKLRFIDWSRRGRGGDQRPAGGGERRWARAAVRGAGDGGAARAGGQLRAAARLSPGPTPLIGRAAGAGRGVAEAREGVAGGAGAACSARWRRRCGGWPRGAAAADSAARRRGRGVGGARLGSRSTGREASTGGDRSTPASTPTCTAKRSAGHVDIGKLRLAVGDMAVEAHGQLHDLRGQPRFDGFAPALAGAQLR